MPLKNNPSYNKLSTKRYVTPDYLSDLVSVVVDSPHEVVQDPAHQQVLLLQLLLCKLSLLQVPRLIKLSPSFSTTYID
jgi:hypothetical protein